MVPFLPSANDCDFLLFTILIQENFFFVLKNIQENLMYKVFLGFGQAKFSDDGLIDDGSLIDGSSQFTLLPNLPPKMILDLKSVKIDSKIIISLW